VSGQSIEITRKIQCLRGWHPWRSTVVLFMQGSSSIEAPFRTRGPGQWFGVGFGALLFCLGLGLPGRAQAAPLHPGPPPIEIEVGDADDPLRVNLGASVWLRGEYRSQPPESRVVVPQRTRVQMEARWRGLTTFIQLQDVRAWGTASPTSTPPTTGLHQGYFEVAGRRGQAKGFVRVGRIGALPGPKWLVWTAPWNPNMRSFDAAWLHGGHGPFSIDVAGALVQAPGRFTLVDDAGNEQMIRQRGEGLLTAVFGVKTHEAANFEAYALLRNQGPIADDPTRERWVFNPGGRLWGKPWRGLSYELEGHAQTGRWDGRGHGAWLGAATLGYGWSGTLRPRIEGAYSLMTGSGCSTAGQEVVCDRELHRDFDPMFGIRHGVLGIVDLFAPTNVHEARAGLRIEPGGWTELRLEFRHFMLHDPTGRWLRTNSTQVGTGPDPENRQRTVGEELDLRFSMHPWGPFTIQAGYGLFLPTGAGPGFLGERPWQLAYVLTQLAF